MHEQRCGIVHASAVSALSQFNFGSVWQAQPMLTCIVSSPAVEHR
jgi:hypothetical protein